MADGTLPLGNIVDKVGPLYRLTEGGWVVINRTHQWSTLTIVIAVLSFDRHDRRWRRFVLTNGDFLLVLLIAALLEAGGDALVRQGLYSQSAMARGTFLTLGAIILFAYGMTVNAPPWDFGRLLGVYVTLFFLVAQLINWLGFGIQPALPMIVGGTLIIAGGLTIAFWRA
jgi:small multidrug resistance family-3 protein